MARERWRLPVGRRRWVALGAVVALGATAVVVWRVVDDGPDAQPPAVVLPPPSGMVVELGRLGGLSSQVGAGTVVPLVASAAGQVPLAAIELWAGDERVVRAETDGESLAWRAAFDWRAAGEDVVLTARSIDVDGRSAISNPVRVSVNHEPITAMATVIEHAVEPDDTLSVLADRYGTAAEAIAAANPGAFGDDLVPLVAVVRIPLQVGADEVAAVELPPISSGFVSTRSTAALPAGIEVDGCEVVVSKAGTATATGIAAYLLPPDGDLFTMMASGPASGSLKVPLPIGRSHLVVGSFDGVVQTFGPLVEVEPRAGCTGGWTGDVRIEGTRLISSVAAESAYLYVSDGSGWMRVPPTGSVPGRRGAFDFAGLLPDLGRGDVTIEAWGRRGGQLTFLGTGHRDPSDSTSPPLHHSTRSMLRWVKSPASATTSEVLAIEGFVPSPGTLTFRWNAQNPLVTSGVWQVTSYPTPDTAGFDVPDVFAQGLVTGNEGLFTIDFAKFAGTQQLSTASAAAAMSGLAGLVGALKLGTPASSPAGAVTAGGLQLTVAIDPASTPLIRTPTRFYVRMLPFIGEQFAGKASNSVVLDTELDIDPTVWQGGPIGQPGSNVYTLGLSVTPPSTPDPWMARCWMITEIDPFQFDLTKASAQMYQWFIYLSKSQYGGTVCPVCYASGGSTINFGGYYGVECDSTGGFNLLDPGTWAEFPIVGDLITSLVKAGVAAWDLAVQIATYLKAKVVEIVALVGCESFVNAGSAAAGSSPPKDAKKWCNTVAEIAVDAALVSAGIPPTLPNFEQAMQLAKGELVDFIVQQASALGIPCDEAEVVAGATGDDTLTCAGVASAVLDLAVKSAKAAVTASAQGISGIAFPPGVSAVPHPKGLVQPPKVEITVTPTAAAPFTGTTCSATVLMTSSFTAPHTAFGLSKITDLNTGYAQNLGLANGLWVKAATYSGFVIQPTQVQLPTLSTAGGALSPATQSYTLGQLTAHDEVQGTSYWQGSTKSRTFTIPYASLHVHPGATLVTSVHSSCALDTSVTGIILPNQQLAVTKVSP